MLLVHSHIKPAFIRRFKQEQGGEETKGIVANCCEDRLHCTVSPLGCHKLLQQSSCHKKGRITDKIQQLIYKKLNSLLVKNALQLYRCLFYL